MLKVRLVIIGLLLSIYSVSAQDYWNINLPEQICWGDQTEYSIRYGQPTASAQYSSIGFSYFQKRNELTGSWEDFNLGFGGVLLPTRTVPDFSNCPFYGTCNRPPVSVAELHIEKFALLSPGEYRFEVRIQRTGGGTITREFTVEIYEAYPDLDMETSITPNASDDLEVCANGAISYEFSLSQDIDALFMVVQKGETVYSEIDVSSINYSFSDNSESYFVHAVSQEQCRFSVGITEVIPMTEPRAITDPIIVDGGIVCKDGKTNTLSIAEQDWADSYTWSIESGSNFVDIVPEGNSCEVNVKDNANDDDKFSIQVMAHNVCFSEPQILEENPISDIIAQADYINSATQFTEDLAICYNSTNIPIQRPSSLGASPIDSWVWYDGSTGPVLNKTFTSDEIVSIEVTDRRGCSRTYEFTADVQEPPIINLPWHHFCEDQDILINLEPELSPYPIQWRFGSSYTAAIENPNGNFDEVIEVDYYTTDGNSCVEHYTQHFEFNPIPDFEPEPSFTCMDSDVTLLGPGAGYSHDWQDVTSGASSTDFFFNISNITETHEVFLTASANGCDFETTYTVGVKESVELILVEGNEKEVCFGEDILLTVPDNISNVVWVEPNQTGNNLLLSSVTADRDITVTGERDGCTLEATVSIEVLELPNLALETTESSYCEDELFTISLTGTVGGSSIDETHFKEIDWSHGIDNRLSNILDFANTTEVSCHVVDYNNCEVSTSHIVTIDDNPSLSMANQYVCEGEDITIYTGAAFNSYRWYNGSSSSSISLTNVQAPVTNAWVRVTDNNGCETVSNFEVQVFDVNEIYFEPVDICLGESTTLTAPSGFTSYTWNTGETTRSIEVSPSSDFTYNCVVSDASCEQSIDFEVRVGNSSSFTLDNIFACRGENTTIIGPNGYDSYAWNYEAATTKDLIFKTNQDFTLSLTAWDNGCAHTASAQVVVVEAENFNFTDRAICDGSSISYTAPAGYNYDWSDDSQDGNQTGTFSPTETTAYTLTIEDAYGCTSTDDFVITVNDFIDFNVPDREICRGTTTEISVLPIYSSILWSTGETTSSIEVSPVSSTSYDVTVTDFNGCEGTATSNITVLDNLAITLDNMQMCEGDFVTIGLDDSNTDYHSFLWNNGSTQSQQDVSPASTTSYSLTVEDENGCSATASMQVTVHTPRSISIDPVTVCQGATAELVSPSGLTEHTWNGNVTNLDAYSLSNMQYNSVVNFRGRDANGCLTYASTNVLVNRNPIVNISDQNFCQFETRQLHVPDIFASVNWSNGSTDSYTDILALENTSMHVTVTDGNGCEATENFDISVYDYSPIDLPNQSICFGQSATISLSGTDWVSYIWSNGLTSQQITESPVSTTNYMVTATDLNGCESTGSMTLTVNEPYEYQLPNIEFCEGSTTTITADPGLSIYLWHTGETTQSIDFTATENELVTLTYTDANGCQGTAQKLAIVYNQPEVFLSDYDVCIGSSVDITAPGGYSYLWDNGSTSRVNSVSPVTNTTYQLIATDGYGCRDTAWTNVSVRSTPSVTLSGYTICPGEVINLDGGSGHNRYYWSNGVTGRYNTVRPTVDTDYNLTVEDIFGCEASATASVIVQSVTPLSLGTIEACEGDTINLMAQGGFATYSWTTGATSRTLQEVLSNYERIGLFVTDANGCEQYDEAVVTTLDKPDYFLASEYVACEGESVDVNITPGYLRYLWSDGSYLNSRTFWPTSPTNYSLTVEHLNGCTLTKSTTVTSSSFNGNYIDDKLGCIDELLEFSIHNSENLVSIDWSTGQQNNSSVFVTAVQDSVISANFNDIYGCEGEASGQLILQSNANINLEDRTICKGETTTIFTPGVYESYQWSTGETTPTITVTGEYTRTISLEAFDQFGCRYFDSFVLTVKDMPDIELQDRNMCYTDTLYFGVLPMDGFSYSWNTGETTSIIKKFVTDDAQYILTVTDDLEGCSLSDTINIYAHEYTPVDIPSQYANVGDIIILSVEDEFASVNWSTGETTNTITLTVDTTTYLYVDVVDYNTCPYREEVFIYVSGPEEYMVSADTVCEGEQCVLYARSGYAGYLWSTGETNSYIITNDEKNTEYSVEITDHAGFKNSFSTNSNIIPGPSIPVKDTTICYGDDLTLRLPAGERSYRWSTGSQSNEITFEDVIAGFGFSVLVEGYNGCISQKSASVSLHQNEYTIIGLKDSYKAGEQINISISSQENVLNCTFYIDGIEYNQNSVNTRNFRLRRSGSLCHCARYFGMLL
jgi:hypothetical protein